MGAARISEALVLDIESCDCLAGCPGCGAIAQGHGRMVVEVIDAPGAGTPVRIRWHNTVLDMPRAHLPDRDLHRAEPLGVRPQGVARHPGDPLSDWSAALRESHHLRPGPITRNHVEHCMLLITAGLDTSPTLNYEDPLQPTEHQRTDMAEYPRERAKRLAPFTSSF